MRYCIESVNKQFDDSWQEFIEEREEESDKNDSASDDNSDDEDEDEKDKDELLSAREQKDGTSDEDEDDEYELNESIKTQQDVVKYFADLYDLTFDESKKSNAYNFNYVNS